MCSKNELLRRIIRIVDKSGYNENIFIGCGISVVLVDRKFFKECW